MDFVVVLGMFSVVPSVLGCDNPQCMCASCFVPRHTHTLALVCLLDLLGMLSIYIYIAVAICFLCIAI